MAAPPLAGLEWRTEGALDAELRMAPDDLLAALSQLADNAARDGAGTLAVRAELHGPALRVEVRDDGPGISPGNRPRVFDGFFTTRREEGGTGMGVAIVRALLEAHGGSAALIDTERGAGFALAIPASDASAPARPPPVRRGRTLAAVLLVVLLGLALRAFGPGLGLPLG